MAGNSFSGIETANIGGNFAPQNDGHPQLVIDQNNTGQITVAWDDSGSGSKASPAFDVLMANTVPAGKSFQFLGSTGIINPGGAGTPNNVPVTTSFTDQVSGLNAAANFTDLTATVALTHPTDANISLVLQSPNNGPSLTLVLNQTDSAGTAHTGQGISGADVGVFGHDTTHFGLDISSNSFIPNNISTVFDDNATRNIFDSTTNGTNGNTAPYIGHFRPEFGSMNSFLQQVIAAGDLNGTWSLNITDFRTETTLGNVRYFGLQFTTNMTPSPTPQHHRQPFLHPCRRRSRAGHAIAIHGAVSGNFPVAAPSSPIGVGPGMVLAMRQYAGAQ